MAQFNHMYLLIGAITSLLAGSSCGNTPNGPNEFPGTSMIDLRATWSEVHNLIAYVHYHELDSPDPDSSGVYLISPEGTGKRLFYQSFSTYSLDWSNDGTMLLINSGGRLVKLAYPSGEVDTLTEGGEYWGAVFSPDGSHIAFARHLGDEAGIYIMPVDGGAQKLIERNGKHVDWPYPDSIIYLSQSLDYPGAVCMIDTTGAFQRVLLPAQDTMIPDSPYPRVDVITGRIILHAQEPGKPNSIWKHTPNSERAVQLRQFAYAPEFSPDANRILYTDIHFDNGRLWIINWDGTGARQITF
jgi:Tol biopolymer transport system component